MAHKDNILYDTEIVTYAAEGKCIARHDGKVVFIKGVVPGDVADLQITKKKSQFYEARPIAIKKLSKERSKPFCEHYGICGGCKWQHLAYPYQLKYKQQQVQDNLERIAKVNFPEIRPIVGSELTTYYRNKLEFTFTESRWLTKDEISSNGELDRRGVGFHVPQKYNKVIDIHHCHLQPDPSNEIRNFIKEFAIKNNLSFYRIVEFKGLLRNLIIRNSTLNETMVIVQFGEDEMDKIEFCMNAIKENFPAITSLNYVINQKKNETFFDLDVINFAGRPFIYERLGGLKFKISPKSFFQTNTLQAKKLYDITKDFAGLTGNEIVYDLYTGTGTIANYLADKASKVIGIDNIEEAIEDARANALENNINNTFFFAGDAKALFTSELINQHGAPEVLIVDPPRAGMHKDIINAINDMKPKKVVYVSCNPATQARDLSLLDESFEIKIVQPVDMFPHTHHVENIVLLNLRKDV